ncbi:MAG: glycosyltransferase [Anaerolineae bacterium]
MDFVHVVLTRFNVPTEFSHGRAPSDDWLRHRLDLFARFARPSLRQQNCREFHWLIFVDEATPVWARESLAARQDEPHFHFCEVPALKLGTDETTARLRQAIRPLLPPETTHLITTRFDNDDAVHVDFVANVQRQFAGQEVAFINFPSGYLWRKGRLYTKRNEANPFISLVETAVNFQTVWRQGHHLLKSEGNIAQVEMEPQWMQVVHGRNVRNRVRDGNIRVPVAQLAGKFGLAVSLPAESAAAIARENRVKAWKRRMRWRLKQARRRWGLGR